MGHDVGVAWPGEGTDAAVGDPVSALARPAVRGIHLPRRLQGEFRGVQGDGPGPVRKADVRQEDLRPSARPEGGRNLRAEYEVLRLLYGIEHDQRQVRRAVRWPAPNTGDTVDAAGDGPGSIHSGRH